MSRTETEIVAELEIVWKGIHKRFSTRNTIYPYNQIDISLVHGPLQHLEGIWQFKPLDDKASKVLLDLEFAFAGGFFDKLFQPVFQHIANTLVDAFCKRAVEIYGTKNT